MSEPESPEPERELRTSGLGRLLEAARRDPGLPEGAIQRVVEKASEAPPPAPPWGSIAALAVLGLAFLGVSAWNHRVASEAEPAPRVEVAPAIPAVEPVAPPEAEVPPTAPAIDDAVEATEASEAAPPRSGERRASAERSVEAPSPAPEEGIEVPSEGALLLRARAALRTDAERALSIAEEHRAAYPEGEMAAEREVLAIEALASLGRFDAARTRAARFGSRYPASPYRGRVEAALARESNAAP